MVSDMTGISRQGETAPRGGGTGQEQPVPGPDRAIRLLLGCGLALALLVAGGAALLAVDLRSRSIAAGTQELARMALALGDQAERALQAVEQVEIGLAGQIQARGIATPASFARTLSDIDTHRVLRDSIAGLPHVADITLLDATGRMVALSRDWPVPAGASLADRDYVRALLPAEAAPQLSSPLRTRYTDTWGIVMARRVSGPEGGLLGMVAATIDLAYFEQLYRTVAQREGDAITLLRLDGTVLARVPPGPQGRGRERTAEILARHAPPPGEGTERRMISPIDGLDRFLAVQRLEQYPLLLCVSRDAKALLRGWHRQVLTLAAGAALVLLGLGGVVALGIRQLRAQAQLARARLDQAEASRAALATSQALATQRQEADRDRAQQEMRLALALDNLVQGLCMVGADGRVQLANRRLAAMLRLTPEEAAPGRALRRLLVLALARGGLARSDLRAIRDRLRALSRRRDAVSFTWELAGGRALAVSFRPIPDGGWLASLQDVTERRQAEARIAHMARHDPLTDLPNRTQLAERLREAAGRARQGQGAALLYLDLDRFKEVNDTLGHSIGDALLRAAAARLLGCVRTEDLVARLGGDEFAVLQAEVDEPEIAATLARRVIEALSLPYELAGQRIMVGASLGIALLPPGQEVDADRLLRQADLALFRVKAEGRGRHRFFAAEMEAAQQARRALELDLRQALAQGEFALAFQPQIRLASGALTGFEALLRWTHPRRGPVPPIDFIPFAEETGLIVPIGAWALRQACAEAASWPVPARISVNLSPLEFRRGTALVDQLRNALSWSGLDPARLELEITETVLLEDSAETLDTLHRLRGLGLGLALDDFGTGYSSLSYLRKFRFDKVKIDQTFVKTLGQDATSLPILRAILPLCASLGMTTVAEGVETEEQAQLLRSLGCDEAQGYLFSRPVPPAELPGVFGRMPLARSG